MAPPRDLRMISVPHPFRCPISLELLRDPVTLITGQTYERTSIEKWLSDGNLTCPVTMQRLEDHPSVTPNHTLRRLIQDWCASNGRHGADRIPNQMAEGAQVLKASRFLEKYCPAGPGFEPRNIDCCEAAEEALGALVQLKGAGAASVLSEPRGLALLSCLLRQGSVEARINAGSLIEMLCGSSCSSGGGVRESVGRTSGVMEGLVWLVRQNHYPRAVKVGTRALFWVCVCSGNWDGAVAGGAVEALVECMVNLQRGDAGLALATVELLCKTRGGREALGGHALGIPVVARMMTMFKAPPQATESATASLLAVCRLSENARREALEAGVFAHLLLLLQSHCTPRAKAKARALLKLLSPLSGPDLCTRILDF